MLHLHIPLLIQPPCLFWLPYLSQEVFPFIWLPVLLVLRHIGIISVCKIFLHPSSRLSHITFFNKDQAPNVDQFIKRELAPDEAGSY